MDQWPEPHHYTDALQFPEANLKAQDLRCASLQLDKLGLPRVCGRGTTAVIYRVTANNQEFALRCFIRPMQSQKRRYETLNSLAQMQWSWFVPVMYQEEGIRVTGRWYPVIQMEWIEGISLDAQIASHLTDPPELESLAVRWRDLVSELRSNRLAHGDLQHGNVRIVRQNRLRLVDYDEFYTPGIESDPPFGEAGHRHYQHPLRGDYYAENMDNFPALVVYTSLLGLRTDPSLWKFHTENSNLIFKEDDFANPGKTAIWQQLRRSPDECVRRLARALHDACPPTSVAAVPALDDIIRTTSPGGRLGTSPQVVGVPLGSSSRSTGVPVPDGYVGGRARKDATERPAWANTGVPLPDDDGAVSTATSSRAARRVAAEIQDGILGPQNFMLAGSKSGQPRIAATSGWALAQNALSFSWLASGWRLTFCLMAAIEGVRMFLSAEGSLATLGILIFGSALYSAFHT